MYKASTMAQETIIINSFRISISPLQGAQERSLSQHSWKGQFLGEHKESERTLGNKYSVKDSLFKSEGQPLRRCDSA